MSTHVLTGDLPERDHSAGRFWGFVASAMPASLELAPAQPVPMLAAAERPDWWTDGTLPGVMAGKRPAR